MKKIISVAVNAVTKIAQAPNFTTSILPGFKTSSLLQVTRPHTYYHANDAGLGMLIPELAKIPTRSADKKTVAIIVGSGCLTDIIGNINADIILVCDYDPNLLRWMHYKLHQLRTCSELKEFYRTTFPDFNQNKFLQNQCDQLKTTLFLNRLTNDEVVERRCVLGEKAMLSVSIDGIETYNQTQFAKNKKAAQEKKVYFVPMNFNMPQDLGQLRSALHDKEIVFANFTNVAQYLTKSSIEALGNLPFHNKALVFYSCVPYQTCCLPQSFMPVQGLDNYINDPAHEIKVQGTGAPSSLETSSPVPSAVKSAEKKNPSQMYHEGEIYSKKNDGTMEKAASLCFFHRRPDIDPYFSGLNHSDFQQILDQYVTDGCINGKRIANLNLSYWDQITPETIQIIAKKLPYLDFIFFVNCVLDYATMKELINLINENNWPALKTIRASFSYAAATSSYLTGRAASILEFVDPQNIGRF